nr:immunoglobulin heavy chain junction region [Mus musculus]MBK4186517.1 immunoglobulin heavy chain junction region [Mus musculus]MBK4186518.1 immunoglobulin heavy chain junction region [Mus musculus]MBK4186520.1 immunoglobulin heavy chain junction region [Mus musculus]MBK4186521.1 immunoglobulin heavy chain junction region [Mus musculus]
CARDYGSSSYAMDYW